MRLDPLDKPRSEYLRVVLEKFQDVFKEAKGMPPPKALDHTIQLVEGSSYMNIRPYRHAYFQKNEIEIQMKLMLEESIIQPSTNPFTSPVLLVKKKDGI